jgi:excinuclease ABC subunit A
VINTPIDALLKWIETLTSTNHPEHPELFRAAAERLLPELSQRLRLVAEVGLGYLAPARAVPTLSSGEARRLALACHAGAELGGVIYVMDEPTAGLHPTDIPRLMGVINRLLEHGNTLVVIEHNMEIIARADHIIDLGPRSGAEGGRVVAAGSPAQVAAVSASITGQCLRARESASLKSPPSLTSSSTPVISVRGIHRHNLTIPDIDIPTKHLVGIAGPSGSGKSTLVFDVLAPSARRGAPAAAARFPAWNTFAPSSPAATTR